MENLSVYPSGLRAQDLTWREQEVLGLLAMRQSNKEIGANLHLAESTVKWYNKQIFSKLGVRNRNQAANFAQEHDLLIESAKTEPENIQISNNLRLQLTSYVERGQEIKEVKQLLASNRLVTLTGPGGSGKTRLALEVAGGLINNYQDGIWQIELAPINDPSLIVKTLANIFRMPENSDEPLIDTLNRFLLKEQLLILVDNFEHMLESAPLIGKILEAAPEVSFLITSRERLSLYGEQEYPVSPLALPDINGKPSTDQILETESVNLFVQRAKASQPNLKLDADNINAIVQICTRLDGLPLAIELAASQINVFPPITLSKRIADDIGALPRGPRNLPARQRTLNSTIAWSYHLLDNDQKTVFDRLSMFMDGSVIEAIEKICSDAANRPIPDIMVELVEKNLVIPHEDQNGEIRFTMLETIREFSKKMFAENQSVEEISIKHATYFADLVEEASQYFVMAGQRYWFSKIKADLENIRKALAWSLNGNEHQFGYRIVTAMKFFWYFNGYPVEGYRWATKTLELTRGEKSIIRGNLLQTAAKLSFLTGDYDQSIEHLNEALKIFEDHNDNAKIGETLVRLGNTFGKQHIDNNERRGQIKLGMRLLKENDAKYQVAYALGALGELSRIEGDYRTAKKFLEECLHILVEMDERVTQAVVHSILGVIANYFKDYQLGHDLMRKAIEMHIEVGTDVGYFCHAVSVLAGPAAELGFPERGVRLLAASTAQRDKLGIQSPPEDEIERQKYISSITNTLGKAAFEAAWQEGLAMNFKEMTSYAREDFDEERKH